MPLMKNRHLNLSLTKKISLQASGYKLGGNQRKKNDTISSVISYTKIKKETLRVEESLKHDDSSYELSYEA